MLEVFFIQFPSVFNCFYQNIYGRDFVLFHFATICDYILAIQIVKICCFKRLDWFSQWNKFLTFFCGKNICSVSFRLFEFLLDLFFEIFHIPQHFLVLFRLVRRIISTGVVEVFLIHFLCIKKKLKIYRSRWFRTFFRTPSISLIKFFLYKWQELRILLGNLQLELKSPGSNIQKQQRSRLVLGLEESKNRIDSDQEQLQQEK